MRWVARAAEEARKDRRQASEDNIFRGSEKAFASTISATLTAMGNARDAMTEQFFHLAYGSPVVQAMVGVDPNETESRGPGREALREQAQAKKRQEFEDRFDQGGGIEAALRSIAWIKRAEGGADERSFAVIKQLHDAQPPGRPRTMAELKAILRDQAMLLRLDEDRAIKAIPKLVPRNHDDRARTLRAVQRVVQATGELTSEGKRRLAQVEHLFGVKTTAAATGTTKEKSDVSA